MNVTTVSSKYQVVIPKEVRRRLRITPGMRFVVIEKCGTLHLVPTVRVSTLRSRLACEPDGEVRDERDRL